MDAAMRRSGIEVIGEVPWGTHFCQFYETGQDLVEVLVPYFREGLASNEFCMWVTSEPLKVDKATDALRAAIPDLDDYIDRGQIEILDYSQWYTRSGKFSADEVLQGWVDKLNAARERGYEGLRLTGNTFWLEQADWDDFTRYEEMVNDVIGRYPMIALCTYSLKKCGAMELLDVVANHQFALIKRLGRWDIIESTHHKKMEQDLRASEERYHALFNGMTEGFALHEIICDDEGMPIDYRFLDINPAFERLTGLKREDVIGKTHNLVLPGDDPRWVKVYGAVALTGEPAQFENYSPALLRHYEVFAYRPTPGQFAVVFMDITQRKRAEDVLQTALQRFYAVLSSMYASILLVTDEGRIEFANQAFCDFFGLDVPPAELMRLTSSQMIEKIKNAYLHPDEEVARISEIVGLGEPVKGEEIAMRGERACLRDFIPICVDGKSYGRLWNHMEITERKRHEEQIAKLSRLYAVLSEVNEAIVRIHDAESLYSEVCRIVAEVGGFPLVWIGQVKEKQIVPAARSGPAADYLLEIKVEVQGEFGKGPTGTCIRENRAVVNDDFAANPATSPWRERALSYGFCASAAFPLHRQGKAIGAFTLYAHETNAFDSKQVGLLESLSADISYALDALDQERLRIQAEEELRSAHDELELRVCERTEELEVANEELLVELEEHRKLEADLVKAKDAAEAAANAKASFLANMSHELRTPLNAVIGFSSLLLDENLTPDQKDYIESIRNGGEALLALIDDILDFSRAEKDKVVLEHQPFSLRALVEESLGMVAVQAENKSLSLASTINYGTPDTIIGDPGRIRQILVNLLSNAVKFTDQGSVSISVSSKPLGEKKHQVLLTVKDTGIGIPHEKMGRLFQPFGQVEYDISRKRDGVGLGLAISKRLVELMGGRIWADSIPKEGSTFSFTFQAEALQGPRLGFGETNRGPALEKTQVQKHMAILVAEDNPSNQKMLVEMLKRMGYRPDAVADGKEVLQALKIRFYDLILMDIRMPEMNGLDATREIRRLWPAGKQPRIIATTAYAMDGDREQCLDAGMDGYIAKPVQKKDLDAILIRCSGDPV